MGMLPSGRCNCCDDHESCCPYEYPVCDVDVGTCLTVKALFNINISTIYNVILMYFGFTDWLVVYVTEQEQPIGSEGDEAKCCHTQWASVKDGKRSNS